MKALNFIGRKRKKIKKLKAPIVQIGLILNGFFL